MPYQLSKLNIIWETTIEFNEKLLGDVRNIYLENADVVFSNLQEPEFVKSELSSITIPENYEFFIQNEKLYEFHNAYGIFRRAKRYLDEF